MSKIRRIGLTRDPPGGWPLDRLFVGVATLRTTRELFRQAHWMRAWDLSLRTGVSPQGSADALARLDRLGLVSVSASWTMGEAPWFKLDDSHLLAESLAKLFHAEYVVAPRPPRRVRKPESVAARAGSARPA